MTPLRTLAITPARAHGPLEGTLSGADFDTIEEQAHADYHHPDACKARDRLRHAEDCIRRANPWWKRLIPWRRDVW